MIKKLVESSKNDLMKWFKRARYGEQCQVVTKQGRIYSHLTKVSPGTVKWKVSGFACRDSDQSHSIKFSEFLDNWSDFEMQ